MPNQQRDNTPAQFPTNPNEGGLAQLDTPPTTQADVGGTSPKTHLTWDCDRMVESGRAIAKIGNILKQCADQGEARRVLVAAGLTLGIYDLTDDGRLITQPAAKVVTQGAT